MYIMFFKREKEAEINNAWLFHDFGLTPEEIRIIDNLNNNDTPIEIEDPEFKAVILALEEFLGIKHG